VTAPGRQSETKLQNALSALTGHNFGSMTATGWIFLPICSQNYASFDHPVEFFRKMVCDSARRRNFKVKLS